MELSVGPINVKSGEDHLNTTVLSSPQAFITLTETSNISDIKGDEGAVTVK